MIAAVVTPTLLYVGVMFVSTGTLELDVLVDSQIPVADVAAELVGPLGSLLMVLGAVLATVSSANASILSAARVNFAMGRDRILINWLNEIHDRFRTPYRSITATGIITLVLIAVGVGIDTLAETASFMYLLTYALVHVAVVVLRRAQPADYEPDFRIPGTLYPVVPVVGGLACLAVLVQMSVAFEPMDVLGVLTLPVRPTAVGIIGAVIVLAGVGWYAVYARERAHSESLLGDAIAPEPRAVADGQGRYQVVVPVANPETERDLLRLAAASAHANDDEHAEVVAVNVIEVPDQTSLSQDLAFEEERVERQQELLDAARHIAADLDVGLRTRAIVGRDAGSAILDVVEEEDADHVLLGWEGHRSTREHVLGSTIDPVVGRASCEVTLVKLGPQGTRGEGDLMVLAGEGPHAPVAARRAGEFVRSAPWDTSLTLLNVQQPGDDEPDADPPESGVDAPESDADPPEPDADPPEPDVEDEQQASGEAVVADLAERAGIADLDYETRVVVGEDVEAAMLDVVDEYDTVCVGATRTGTISQALFGSIPETIGERAAGTVVMARGPEESPLSMREAIAERLRVN
jgi:nucleotide-binding universal stress UspA family protein/drug/metabolite transporter (DMT)-like permease